MKYLKFILIFELIIATYGNTKFKDVNICSSNQNQITKVTLSCYSYQRMSISNITAYYTTTAEKQRLVLNNTSSQQTNLIKQCYEKRVCNALYYIRLDYLQLQRDYGDGCLRYQVVYKCKYVSGKKKKDEQHFQYYLIIIPLFIFLSICFKPA